MIELDKTSVKQWSKPQRDRPRLPINIEVDCPSCGKTLGNSRLEFTPIYNYEIFQARVVCMLCGKPAHLIMVNWVGTEDLESFNARLFIDPSPKLNLGLPDNVDFLLISSRFVKIYEQAIRAKQMGHDELVGIGYRKALEFLLKDYLIAVQPGNQAAIQSATLGQCINNYIQDPRLLKAAKHASWLGNDETHYERRNATSDVKDLEQLMALTLHWIAMETLTREL